MFKFLKRSELTVALDVQPTAVAPGGEIQLRATLQGRLDDKVDGMRYGVRCKTRYTIEEYDSSDRDTDRSIKGDTVHEDIRELSRAEGAGGFGGTIQLPADALPSAHEAVEWKAFAVVSRRRGRDSDEEVELAVTLPSERVQVPPRSERALSGDDATFIFDGISDRVRPGEALTGTLVVTVTESVSATDVRVELRRIRRDWAHGVGVEESAGEELFDAVLGIENAEDTLVFDDTPAEAQLGGGELRSGTEHRFEFTLNVPRDAQPTLRAPNTTIDWRLRAVVARRMREDFAAEVPIGIYTG